MAHQSLDVNLFFKAKQKKSISIKKKAVYAKEGSCTVFTVSDFECITSPIC